MKDLFKKKKTLIIGTLAVVGVLVLLHIASKTRRSVEAASYISKSVATSHAQQQRFNVGDRLEDQGEGSNQGGKVSYQKTSWDDLMPADWDPMSVFKGLKVNELSDSDPRAINALEKAKAYWKRAPVNKAMHGRHIRIPGFVVSLDREGEALKEFLLVPYFGGCIHVPPPPINQIIHVKSIRAVAGIRTMDPVWVSGEILVKHSDTVIAAAGYVMTAEKIERYTGPEES